MKRLRELLYEMSYLSEMNPDGAIVYTKDGTPKVYSKEEAEMIRDQWWREN